LRSFSFKGLRWFGHVKRMYEHKVPRRLLEMKISGRRPRDRRCTQRADQVKRKVKGKDKTVAG
jgi:hypothetical protein